MDRFALITVGASAGGVDALQRLVAGLEADIPAAILIVQHVGSRFSMLPELLAAAGRLPAAHARQHEAIQPSRIYIAPPDQHLRVVDGVTDLIRGPRENWTRPAIDPLFRTAARAYGSRVIGVILTGMLNDGTAGLREVAAHGGTTVVQDPEDARYPEMPLSAVRHVAVDYVLPLTHIPEHISKLAMQIAGRGHRPAAEAGGQCHD